jgi:uncharacterized protein (TIGR03083 family)
MIDTERSRRALTASKDEIVRAVAGQRRATLALIGAIDPAQFDAPTALPGWRVREVVAHLISLDVTGVTGEILPVALGSTERLERWNDRQVRKRADRPVPNLLVAMDRWCRRFVRVARLEPAILYRTRMPTQWGRGPAGLLGWSRANDAWIHRQDLRRALGMGDEEVDVAPVVEFLLNARVVGVLPELSGRTGRVSVSPEGSPVAEWVFDLASGTAGPRGGGEAEPDATIRIPAGALVMAASGHDRFDDLLADHVATIDGGESLAREFLAKTRIV